MKHWWEIPLFLFSMVLPFAMIYVTAGMAYGW